MFGIKAVAIYAVVFVLVSVVSSFLHLKNVPPASHPVLLTAAIVVCAAGFIAGTTGVLSLVMAEGHQLTEEEQRAFSWRQRVFFRMVPGPLSRVVWFDFSMGETKAAWRSGEWKRDPHWRRAFAIVGGAVAMLLGFLCAMLIISTPAARPMVIIWLVFSLVWLGWGVARG